jgi:hypothetical protein
MKEHFLTQLQHIVLMEEEDEAFRIVEMLLLMDVVAVMKDAEKDQQEIPIVTEMSDNAGEMTQFVASTEDIHGDNAMITQEDKVFAPQEILVATQIDMDLTMFCSRTSKLFCACTISSLPTRWSRE